MIVARRPHGGTQRRRVRASTWTPAKRAVFLEMLGLTANVQYSVAAAGMSSQGVYKLFHRDATFAAQWDQALCAGYRRLGEQMLECALLTLTGGVRFDGTTVEAGPLVPLRLSERTILLLLERHDRRVTAAEAAAARAAERGPEDEQARARLLEKLGEMRLRLSGPAHEQ